MLRKVIRLIYYEYINLLMFPERGRLSESFVGKTIEVVTVKSKITGLNRDVDAHGVLLEFEESGKLTQVYFPWRNVLHIILRG